MTSAPQVSASLARVDPRLRTAVRAGVRAVNTPLARRRLASALASAPRPLKLEIGGIDPRPGWLVTNVNAVTRLYLDATSRWPVADGDVAYAYADNVIEHIPLEAGRRLLAEAHRCLRPGGVLRLVTPDIAAYVELYRQGDAAVKDEVADFYRSLGLTVEHPVDLVRVPIASFGHHTGYLWDFDALEAELRRAGFTDVTRWALGESGHAEFRGFDRRNDEGSVQLVVEAVR